jgi:hypothetical protein
MRAAIAQTASIAVVVFARNVAGAMVVASRDFGDPNILVMVTASVLAGLLVLFPIAWLLSKRAVFPTVGEAIRAYVERAEADLGRDVDWRRVDEPPRPSGGAA